MSIGGILLLAFIVYFIYIKGFRPLVISKRYGKDKTGVETTESFDAVTLHNYLLERNFTYPELKNIRINQHGQVVIEGKYSSHPITIQENRLFVERGEEGGDQKAAKCILEAVVISHYLTKLFNPMAPVDAYEQFRKFKKRRNQSAYLSTIFIIFIVIAFAANGGTKAVQEATTGFSSNNISSSHLTQYSSSVTIGDAFNAFFGDPKWKSYDQGIEKYVDFQGKITFDGEPATATITFWLSDDQFIVERIKVNNRELMPGEFDEFLEVVYAESK